MKSSTIVLLLLAVAPDAQADRTPEAVERVIESAQQSISAIPIERSAPRYPRLELLKGNQAWVQIAYCIDKSGLTQNVSVLDSVGGRRFDKAATDIVKKWKFEPALIDGEPSWQSRNQTYITFAIEGGNTGASRKFKRQFQKINELIKQQKLQEANELFQHIRETYSLSLYEFSKLWEQRVRYEVLSGDMYRVDMALHRATASEGEWIDRKSYIQLLTYRIMVELEINKYHAANSSFDELVEAAGIDAEEVLALRPTMDLLQEQIDGDKIVSMRAEVRSRDECNECNNSWNFTPVRNDFSFANIKGNLESIEMRCDHKRFQSAVSDLIEWHIPDNWGTCRVQVYGDPGTTFDVFLFPNS